MCGTKRLNAFSDYTRPVRYFRSVRVHLLLLFMDKIRGKDKTSLHCSYGCRYSMAQNAVVYLCEMAPMAKLKCAPFLIIYVLYQVFFKENVRYQEWICRDPISLILGTRFSLILGTR